MLELYHFNDSVCAQKVRVVLAEKHLDWVPHHVDLMKLENLDPAYLKLNPNGVVPTLVHDGAVVIESSEIIEYLDEHFPDPPLRPADPGSLGRHGASRGGRPHDAEVHQTAHGAAAGASDRRL
jgi:glutathione S-transferase